MRVKTLLNKCLKYKHFVISKVVFDESDNLIVKMIPRKNSKIVCSKCNTLAPGYDKIGVRLFEFIPIWGFHIFLNTI